VSASLANNMLDWIASASTVSEIYQKAGYQLPTDNIKGLAKIFTVNKKQETSSVVSIAYSSTDKIKAQKIIEAANSVLQQKVVDYNKNDQSAEFITRSNQPVVITAPKQTALNTIISVFLGFVISLGIVSIKEAIK